MSRKEIEQKVKALMVDELEIEEDKIFPEASLKMIWVLTVWTTWTLSLL